MQSKDGSKGIYLGRGSSKSKGREASWRGWDTVFNPRGQPQDAEGKEGPERGEAGKGRVAESPGRQPACWLLPCAPREPSEVTGQQSPGKWVLAILLPFKTSNKISLYLHFSLIHSMLPLFGNPSNLLFFPNQFPGPSNGSN